MYYDGSERYSVTLRTTMAESVRLGEGGRESSLKGSIVCAGVL